MQEILLRAQMSQPLNLVYCGATRWNSKVDAMSRLWKLSGPINYVMEDTLQKPYALKQEEIRSLEKAVKFLSPFCVATDVAQQRQHPY